jgi:hypothetical protein
MRFYIEAYLPEQVGVMLTILCWGRRVPLQFRKDFQVNAGTVLQTDDSLLEGS